MKFNELDKKRADALWILLKENEGHFITQEYVCSVFPNLFKWVQNSSGGTDGCRELWTTVQYINYSLDFDGIVVIKNRQYKIANEKEAEKYYRKTRKNGIKKLVRARFINEKLAHKGQISLFDFSEKVLDEATDMFISYLKNNAKVT